jgi:hypothetical protein
VLGGDVGDERVDDTVPDLHRPSTRFSTGTDRNEFARVASCSQRRQAGGGGGGGGGGSTGPRA